MPIPAVSPPLDMYALRLPSMPRRGAGILTCFSFAPGCTAPDAAGLPPRPAWLSTPFNLRFPVALRAPANPQATAVVEEPSSTSAFRVLHMNTCYYYQDLLPGPVHAPAKGRFNPTSGIRPTRLRTGIAPGMGNQACPLCDRTRPGMTRNR